MAPPHVPPQAGAPAKPAWPGFTPEFADAMMILRGDIGVPREHAEATRRILEAAHASQRRLLRGEVPPEERPLLEALVCQWRMEVATAMAAAQPPTAIDAAALEQLGREVDTVFESLRRITSGKGTKDRIRDAAEVRSRLAQANAEFAQLSQRLASRLVGTDASETPAAERPAAPPPAPRTRGLRSVPPKRRISLLAAILAVTIAAAATFFGLRLAGSGPAAAPPSWVPAQARLIPAPPGGPRTLATVDGRPLPPQDLTSLQKSLAREGLSAREIAPGQYAISSTR